MKVNEERWAAWYHIRQTAELPEHIQDVPLTLRQLIQGHLVVRPDMLDLGNLPSPYAEIAVEFVNTGDERLRLEKVTLKGTSLRLRSTNANRLHIPPKGFVVWRSVIDVAARPPGQYESQLIFSFSAVERRIRCNLPVRFIIPQMKEFLFDVYPRFLFWRENELLPGELDCANYSDASGEVEVEWKGFEQFLYMRLNLRPWSAVKLAIPPVKSDILGGQVPEIWFNSKSGMRRIRVPCNLIIDRPDLSNH